ncbi:hypothetical protein [Chthonobacter albigriseus]|uniref:hypothetical protein n=1 Tax=Chthonobacter albigriseus TaxID=1683161 RepID=UPI0015EE9D83|nr:hypothetical protein [Chthonobacter albigriseus]
MNRTLSKALSQRLDELERRDRAAKHYVMIFADRDTIEADTAREIAALETRLGRPYDPSIHELITIVFVSPKQMNEQFTEK